MALPNTASAPRIGTRENYRGRAQNDDAYGNSDEKNSGGNDQRTSGSDDRYGTNDGKRNSRFPRWQRQSAEQLAKEQAISEKERELDQTKKEKATLFSYTPVFMLALLKDLLDLVGIGSLPAIGTIVTFCISTLIFLLFFLIKANKKFLDMRFFMRMGVTMLLGSMVEGFAFGLNFLPIETITIFVIFFMDRHFSDKSIERINNIIHLFRKSSA